MPDLPWLWIVSLWASVQALFGMYLLTNVRTRWGCMVSLTNQVPWIILALLAHTYGTFLLSGVMVFITIRGWRNWNVSKSR